MAEGVDKEGGCNGCLCLVYGIPGSGKTALSDSLAGDVPKGLWQGLNVVAMHFDNMYPLDLRATTTGPQVEGASGGHFDLKCARQSINACLEHYIALHIATACVEEEDTTSGTRPPPDKWEEFFCCVIGEQSSGGSATAVLIDDNLPLRSMRYQYYQLARKYGLGFAEVCITCSLATALERNSKRPIPIPHSTITDMEQKLELPDPFQYHWEERNVTLTNNEDLEVFLTSAKQSMLPLIQSAIANPVPRLAPKVDPQLQESSRFATLESFVHQADIILRKCVSQCLASDAIQSQDRAFLARQANAIRKRLLEQIRTGRIGDLELASSNISPTGAHFGEMLRSVFSESMYAIT